MGIPVLAKTVCSREHRRCRQDVKPKVFLPHRDCRLCANCCRSLPVEFKKSDLLSIAQTLGQSIKAFEKQFMSEGKVNPPCPMLDGKLCSIYEDRPEVCRSYPHLEQPHFTSRLMSVIDNVAICPIAFNAFEKLKTELGWSRDRHKRQR